MEVHQGELPVWDFQYQAFRISLDNALKILHRDRARRTKKEDDAITDYFLRSYRSVGSKEQYEEQKIA